MQRLGIYTHVFVCKIRLLLVYNANGNVCMTSVIGATVGKVDLIILLEKPKSYCVNWNACLHFIGLD